MAIGDGHLSVRQRFTKDKFGIPKYAYIASELVIGHSPKQAEYIAHKAGLIHSVIGGKTPTISTCTHKIGDKEYKTLRIAKSSPYFRQMHRVLYPLNTKTYTEQLLSYLDAHSLALWYMDDGSRYCNKNADGKITSIRSSLSTQCSKEEAELIIDWLWNKFKLEAKLRPSKGRFDIGFNTAPSHILNEIIKPYVVPSMAYKTAY